MIKFNEFIFEPSCAVNKYSPFCHEDYPLKFCAPEPHSCDETNNPIRPDMLLFGLVMFTHLTHALKKN